MTDGRTRLLYDRDCGFCTRCLDILRRLDRRGRVDAVALQTDGAPESVGVTTAEALDAAWAIDDRGVRWRGAGAILAAASAALGTRLPLRIYRIPLIRSLLDGLYAWIATNRYRLPGSSGTCSVPPRG